MKEFKDKVAVITGGASGIGLGIARKAASNGMKICISDIEEDSDASWKQWSLRPRSDEPAASFAGGHGHSTRRSPSAGFSGTDSWIVRRPEARL